MAALAFSIKRALQLTCVAVLAMGSLHAAFAQTSSAVEVKPASATASLNAVPNVEKAWQAHANYKKHLELKAKGQEQDTTQMQRAAIEEITTSYLEQYFYPVLSERSRNGIWKKVDFYPLQIRVLIVNFYLKGARQLVSPNDRGGFAAGVAQFMDSVYNGGGNSELLAKNIGANFSFIRNVTFPGNLVKAGAQADRITQLTNRVEEWKTREGRTWNMQDQYNLAFCEGRKKCFVAHHRNGYPDDTNLEFMRRAYEAFLAWGYRYNKEPSKPGTGVNQ